MAAFPDQREGVIYVTEGGQETELMYKFGFELPEFAMYPLLDNPQAMAALRGMYERILETAAKHRVGVLLGGLDYRASPDWGEKLGYSHDGLADAQFRCIGFLREAVRPFESQIPEIKIVGCVGPRGDAYKLNRAITAEDAEQYHGVQIDTLKRAGVDLISAMTFNNVDEAVGVARAAFSADMPLTVSFTLDSTHRLKSGLSLKQAIEQTDARTGDARPAFYGINCSHPLEFEPALEPGDWFKRVRSLRPNASAMEKVALCKIGHLEDGDPVELGEQMGALARRYDHIDVWGGCCGTWERHLDHIAGNVKRAREGA